MFTTNLSTANRSCKLHFQHIFRDVIKGKVLIIILPVISSMVMVLLFTSSYKFSSSYSTNLHLVLVLSVVQKPTYI